MPNRNERRRLERIAGNGQSNVPILGHDLSIRLDPFCMNILAILTAAERVRNPSVSRNVVATAVLSQALHQGAMNILVADHLAAVLVCWGGGKAELIGPIQGTFAAAQKR